MVILKHTIIGSSLVEVIVALSLTSFLFGVTAWFLVSLDQSKYVHRNALMLQLLLNQEKHTNIDVKTIDEGQYNIEMHLTEINEVLSESTVYLLHKRGDTVYQFSTIKSNQGDEENF